MTKIPDDLLDAAVTAYTDAIDLDVTSKHLMTKVLEAVIPLIAAMEREECAKLADLRTTQAYPSQARMAAGFIADNIRTRGEA